MKHLSVIFYLLIGLMLSACQAERQLSFQEMQEICEDERRKAAGPTGKVTIGSNNQSGGFGRLNVTVSDKFIRGLDPNLVYQNCMSRLSEKNSAKNYGQE